MVSLIASDWSPSSRRAPPLLAGSPSALRVTVLPLESALSSLPQAANGSTATAAMTTAALKTALTDTLHSSPRHAPPRRLNATAMNEC